MPNELSGGMRKRAGFARALVLDPAIVMFDEPDSGLDPVRTALLCELIREVHEENGGCYMVISHDLGTARRIADFIAVLWKGQIVESGPTEELFNSENEFVSPVPQRGRRRSAGDGLIPSGSSLTAWAVRHARAVIAVCALLAVAGGVGATRLRTDAGTDTLAGHDSPTYVATQRFKRLFGDDAVVVLVKGDLRGLVLTKNLGTLLSLESCLSGRVPPSEAQPGACTQIARLRPSRVVYGPATFLNQSVIGIKEVLSGQIAAVREQARLAQQQGGKAAAQAVIQQFTGSLFQLAAKYGIDRVPSLNDPLFVSQVVFDTRLGAGMPKARFAYLFPSPHAALISVRMRADLTERQRQQALGLYRSAVADPRFKLDAGSYVVSGVPIVVQGLAGSLKTALLVLLGAALVIMAATLLLVFSPPLRLLPLVVALAAAGIAFGLLALTGGALTMASIAVLPVLIGLAVDYAIQFQARFNEQRAAGTMPRDAAVQAAARGAPVIATACLATAAGFAALLLSPVPMVRSFGLLLVVGVAVALALALTLGFSVLSLSTGVGTGKERFASLKRAQTQMLALAISKPVRILVAATALSLLGWVASTQTPVVSDISKLVPGNLPAVKGLNELQKTTGVSGELDVSVRAPDLTDPATITWMRDFQGRVLSDNGFKGAFASCAKARVCPSASLPDLFAGGGAFTEERAQSLINAIPQYASQAVVTRNPATGEIGHTANIAFGIRVMPLDRQQRLIENIKREIGAHGGPPAGVDAVVAGLPAIAAQANSDLQSSRYWLTLAGLLAVALVLLGVYRSRRRALVPLIPIVLAGGWSALVILQAR